MSVSYYCNCHSIETYDTIIDNRTFHSLKKLQFCEKCQQIKCPDCLEYEISLKYCGYCYRIYQLEDTHCPRCYNCPVCDSHLSVNARTHKNKENTKIEGKSVFFKCGDCHWEFNTGVETRPQPLQKIVQNVSKGLIENRFEELTKFYNNQLDYMKILDMKDRRKYKDELIQKFTSLEIAAILNKKMKPECRILPLDMEVDDEVSKCFPNPALLNTKELIRCNICRSTLTLPDTKSDPKFKDYIKSSFARDIIPEIKVSQMPEFPKDKFLKNGVSPILLSFINYAKESLEIELSTDDEIIAELNSKLSKVEIDIPTTKFTVPARQSGIDKVKMIPTVLLDKHSSALRMELVERSNEVFPRLAWDEHKPRALPEKPLEIGHNWLTIRLNVNIKTIDERDKLQIPLRLKLRKGNSAITAFCKILFSPDN